MNPNGYEFTFTSDRLWQKNRALFDDTFCRGVFLDQNYDYQFSDNGNPCRDDFSGYFPYSG
jgi:hypothetical protein